MTFPVCITVQGGWIWNFGPYQPAVYVPDPGMMGLGANVARDILAAMADLKTEMQTMSQSLQSSIDLLIADNTALKAAVDAAPAAIATLVATAIAGAASQGATAAQLQSMADLHTALGGETSVLQAALAGTAPAPTPTPAPADPAPAPTPAPADPAPAPVDPMPTDPTA